MSKRRRTLNPLSSTWSTSPSPSPSPSPPPEDDEWYAIKEILGERRKHGDLEYLVDWEGTDPKTGDPYCRSWIPASEVTLDAIAEWQSRNSRRAIHLQGASPRPRTTRAIARPAAESSSGGSARPVSSQEQRRAASLQADVRPPKRRRLRRAVTQPSSPVTDSQDHAFPPSQPWEALESQQSDHPEAADLVVELPPVHHLDQSDYLSVHLSQASTEGATQSSPSASTQPRHFSSHHQAISQRTIPDSQESLSHDTPNDPLLLTEGLRSALEPPLSQPLSQPAATSDSWPSVVSRDHVPVASQGWDQPPAGSPLSSLPRPPSRERRGSRGTLVSQPAERSEPSIPPHQHDSFHVQHNSPSISVSCSHSAGHERRPLQTDGLHLSSLTHVSESASSGPEFLTQPQSLLRFPLGSSQVSPAHPTDSGATVSVVPDSLDQSSSDRTKSTQGRDSLGSHAADYGSAQPRGSLYYASQAVPNLLDTSQQLSGPESSSAGELFVPVPETVLRKPNPRLSLGSTESSPVPHSQGVERGSRPYQSPVRQNLNTTGEPRSADSPVTPPNMDTDYDPQESPAIAELFQIQRDSLSGLPEPAFLGSAESPNDGPRQEDQSPLRGVVHDPMMPSSRIGDDHPGGMDSSLASNPVLQAREELPAPNSQLFATQDHLQHSGAESHPEDPVPVTVAPSDIQPQEIHHLTVAPSDITADAELPTTSSRQLPLHDNLFSERQGVPVDIPTDMTVSEDEYEADDSQDQLPDDEPKDYTVTLPFPANQRPFYDDLILQSRSDIEDFCRVFSNEVLRTPKRSDLHKIESLFVRLLDVCDYPPQLDDVSWNRLSPKEVQNYLYESSAKFALIWDILDYMRDTPVKVLVVARSERLLSFLETLALVEGYAFSRTGLQSMQFHHARSPVNIVLALPDQTLPDSPSDFDIIFGYDFEFKRSVVANELAQLQPSQKRPMVLSLVIAHSLEHIDLCITEKDPDIPELDRKNALVVALTKVRGMVVNPELGRAKPHKIAQHFANLLGGAAEPCDYEPVPLPDSVLDVYIDATQPEERRFDDEESGDNSRKRKLDDFEDNGAKRQKLLSSIVPMVDTRRVEALSPLIRCLGAEVLDGGDVSDEVTIPRALLNTLETKFKEQQRALEESMKREQEYKRTIANLSRERDEYASSINTIQTYHREALEERARFERDKLGAESKVQSLETRLLALEEEKSKLASEVAELKAAPAKDSAEDKTATVEPPEASSPEKDIEAARAEVQRITKRLENAERDLEYTREAYQNASHAASDLGNENRDLAGRIKDLEHRASENLLAIHKVNIENQIKVHIRAAKELEVVLREREGEIDRLREELRAYKMRRETRQSSVPRSPRMGVMSPRARMPGGASRGSSPAPLDGGLQMFGQQAGNGRWGHLRD